MSNFDSGDFEDFWDSSSISTAHTTHHKKVIKILTIKPFEHQDVEIHDLIAFFEDIVEHKNTATAQKQRKNSSCVRCQPAPSKKALKYQEKFEAQIGAQVENDFDCPGVPGTQQFDCPGGEGRGGIPGDEQIFSHQLLIMQFQMLERKIRSIALQKAEAYLEKHSAHRAYSKMINMVQQTYQIVLTPDNAFKAFRDSLSHEQRNNYLMDNLRLLNIKDNKHPMAAKAEERLNQYFRQ